MDLLFRNPKYFFETYFGISIFCFFAIWILVDVVLIALYQILKTNRSFLWITCMSLFVTIVLTVSLINPNRSAIRDAVLNPLPHFVKMINGNVHFQRETLSNILLYLPIGFLLAMIKMRMSRGFLLVFLLSLSIESMQYVFCRGWFETADIITNVCGGVLGLIAAYLLRFCFQSLPESNSKH